MNELLKPSLSLSRVPCSSPLSIQVCALRFHFLHIYTHVLSIGRMLKRITAFLDRPGLISGALKKLPGTPSGHRLVPPKTSKNDESYQFRLDKGTGNRISLQANSNAKESAVRNWIRKQPRGSHTTIASVDTTGKSENEVKEQLKALAEENLN